MVEAGLAASGFAEVGLLSLSSADHSEINAIATDLADRYEGTNTGLSLPSTRVDAFNVTLADELSRNGRRSGLTFAPEGGTDRIRRVINKMVTRGRPDPTVTTAYASGWRQVKLYFMCGLPTETDDDVLAIAQGGHAGDRGGAEGEQAGATSGAPCRSAASCPSRIRRSSGRPSATTRRSMPGCGRSARRCVPTGATVSRSASGTTTASRRWSRACCPAVTGGSPKVIRAVWEDGGRFDGWSEHF